MIVTENYISQNKYIKLHKLYDSFKLLKVQYKLLKMEY